jgi:hypothetical protein
LTGGDTGTATTIGSPNSSPKIALVITSWKRILRLSKASYGQRASPFGECQSITSEISELARKQTGNRVS